MGPGSPYPESSSDPNQKWLVMTRIFILGNAPPFLRGHGDSILIDAMGKVGFRPRSLGRKGPICLIRAGW